MGSVKGAGACDKRAQKLKTKRHLRVVTAADGAEVDEAWRRRLKESRNGILPTAANVTAILRYHPEWSGVVAYDAFIEALVVLRVPPWDETDMPVDPKPTEWSDNDTARFGNWLARKLDMSVTEKVVEQGLAVAGDAHRVHPVRDYLASIRWDGKRRLDGFVPVYLRGEDTPYTRLVGPKFLISAVARAMEPGCQVDHVLITESKQGDKKSSAFRALAPNAAWYSETPVNLGDKDSYQLLRGIWFYCWDELCSLQGANAARAKNFITSTVDRYRPSYARRPRAFRRQCVICGTTNDDDGYLTDRTGNRRYWGVRVGVADIAAIKRDRDQLFAEAFHRYTIGEKWWPTNAPERALCESEQNERRVPDDWQVPIETWVRENDDGNGVLTFDVLSKAIQRPRAEIKVADTMRAADVLRRIGYVRGERTREGAAIPGEGRSQVRRYVLADRNARAKQARHYRGLEATSKKAGRSQAETTETAAPAGRKKPGREK